MNDDEFELADEEIADAISANISYFGDANQRNLLGLEFVIGAAATIGLLFLHSFLKEAGKQAERIAKLSAKRLGNLIAERLKAPKPERERETRQIRGKARELAARLPAKDLDAHLAGARADIARALAEAGIPQDSAQTIAAKTAAAMTRALKSAAKRA